MSRITRATAPALNFAPVRVSGDESVRASGAPRLRPVGQARATVPIVELVLLNGRVLRVAETISSDALGRLAAALDA